MATEKQDSTTKIMRKISLTDEELQERVNDIYQKECFNEIMNAFNNKLFWSDVPPRVVLEEHTENGVTRYRADLK